jgi:nitronate monooxygenase
MATLLEQLGVTVPVFQAPMAGVSTPAMAAAVSNAGALGGIAVGATTPVGAAAMIAELRALTRRAFNVNVFVHQPPRADSPRERGWLDALAPSFRTYGAEPPRALQPAYPSFLEGAEMLAVLIKAAAPVVSFHFGLPTPEQAAALRAAGALLFASATSLAEGLAAQQAGMDAIVAQGYEAGGHRGVFDPAALDERLGTIALTRVLVNALSIPVIAAGGIMDGAAIAAALSAGAVAAQLGTAFVACPESSASAAHKSALLAGTTAKTVMTPAISGRPARCLVNRFTALGERLADIEVPDYPIAYDAGKALHAAAVAKGEYGYGAQWAGQGAPQARALPAAELVAMLVRDLQEEA